VTVKRASAGELTLTKDLQEAEQGGEEEAQQYEAQFFVTRDLTGS